MKKYIFLITLFFLGVGFYLISGPSVCFGNECFEELSFKNPASVKSGLLNNSFVLIDVREKQEWDLGHIGGAINISLGSIGEESLSGIPKDREIYVYCRSGRRAGEAEEKIKMLGFSNVKNLGGILEWEKNGGKIDRILKILYYYQYH